MGYLLIRLIINAVALWVATRLVPGISAEGDIGTLLVVALIFGLINAFIRPILSVLTCPLQILTLGLFTLVVNAVMLWLTGFVAQQLGLGFSVNGFIPALLGGIIVTVVSIILTMVFREDDRRRR